MHKRPIKIKIKLGPNIFCRTLLLPGFFEIPLVVSHRTTRMKKDVESMFVYVLAEVVFFLNIKLTVHLSIFIY